MNIAIVTGASSGVGRAFLEEWQRSGAQFDEVWLIARHAEALHRTAQTLPWSSRRLPLDLSQTVDRARLAAQLAEVRPQVSALVNAAGYGKMGAVRTIDPDEQTGMIDLNCTALVDLCQRVLPYMTRGSTIYNIASVAAFLPQPGFATYAATKAFVLSFSRALAAEERAHGIRVIAVCPNPMPTGFFDRAGQAPTPIKRLGFESPAAVARTAIRHAQQGRDLSTNCLAARAIRLLAKLLPHRLILTLERRLMK